MVQTLGGETPMPAPGPTVPRRAVLTGGLGLAVAAGLGPARLSAQTALPTIVVLPTDLQDDHENPATVEAQKARLKGVQARLAEQLQAQGLYRVVDLAPAQALVDESLAAQAFLYKCADCAQSIGRAAGADLVMVSWVQKVSELILNLNAEVLRVSDGRSLLVKSVDMRGNTDIAWDRGARYLVKQLADERGAAPPTLQRLEPNAPQTGKTRPPSAGLAPRPLR
jgi:hypothetical protein